MKLLVIDKLLQQRSGGAECDMYEAMRDCHELIFTGDNLLKLLWEDEYDALWLGPYHHRMDINWHQVFHINRKPVYISQADNEEFARMLPVYPEGTTILCRYLPNHAIENYADANGYSTRLLPWFIDGDKIPSNPKTCDVAFICSMKSERRIEISNMLREVCDANDWTFVIGEYYGQQYYELLSKCRVMVVESDRGCMTLKYIEGSLAGCLLVGDIPSVPPYDAKVMVADLDDAESIQTQIGNALSYKFKPTDMRATHASREWFLKQLDRIL